MPRLRLPPLPPSSAWDTLVPKSGLRRSGAEGYGTKELARRFIVASKPLADSFVRELGIRKDEVVIEAYGSVGQVTRSLLAGGYDATTPSDWHQVCREQAVVGPVEGRVKRRNLGQFTFPPWDVDEAQPPSAPPPASASRNFHTPKAVIAVEPTVSQLSRGLGFDPDNAPITPWDLTNAVSAEELGEMQERRNSCPVIPSITQPGLLLCPETVFDWETVPKILENPVVYSQLPVYDDSKTGAEARKRPWDAPAPHITMVANIPDTVLGDQLISQWIASAIGRDNERSWLWAYGRVRLAALLTRNTYDRIMASPGETIHCKLSVMANALFRLRPLPPYHHVPDVDKHSTRTDTAFETREMLQSAKKRNTIPAPPPTSKVTPTTVGDWYPHTGRLCLTMKNQSTYPPETRIVRPPLLGVEFVPREKPLIKLEQREEWDFVLRHCFIRESKKLGDVLPLLAFGANNLIPKIAQKGKTPYAGMRVDPETPIRHLTVEQWARVVDVFARWPFKPELLLMDAAIEDSRQIGTS